jgi:Cu(I)/Ag(I) efflux system periplasmic protein CusF
MKLKPSALRQSLTSASVAASLCVAFVSSHAAVSTHSAATPTPLQAGATADMADAEVRKVDMEGAKLTLKHGEIRSLDMPPMTMVFGVKDKALLEKVKAGDKIKFKAVKDGGRYIVTELAVVK